MSGFTFYSRSEYYAQLTELANGAQSGDRIAVATMSFYPDEPEVKLLVDALCGAAERGADVYLQIDSFSFLLAKVIVPGPLFYGKTIPKRLLPPYAGRMHELERLRKSGGHYTITNRPRRRFSLPFAGRSHIKFAVINDVTIIGGCNLTQVKEIDLMVRQQNSETADWLFDFVVALHANQSVRGLMRDTDHTIKINEQTSLLIDAGVPQQSAIFDAALSLIDEAQESILMTCQYFPNEATIIKLNKAIERGVDVTLIYNSSRKHPFPKNLLHGAVKFIEKQRRDATLFSNELSRDHDYLHAKLLVSEKTCIVGSHNYIQTGVNFGTAEIAYVTQDRTFAEAVTTKLKSLL